MDKEKILIVEDIPESLKHLSFELMKNFELKFVRSGGDATLENLNEYAGFLVDIHLPDFSGDQLIYELKKLNSGTAFYCAITGENFEESLLTFSNSHIDDFLNKNTSVKECYNRIYRCYENQKSKSFEKLEYSFENLKVNLHTVQAFIGEDLLTITLIEFKIFLNMVKNLNHMRYVPKHILLKNVWGEIQVEENTINTHVSNLNKKIKKFNLKLRGKRFRGFYFAKI